MSNREPHGKSPLRLLRVAGFVVFWAAASGAMSQMRELVVTEVHGSAVRSSNGSQVRALEGLKAGERVRLSSDSRIGLFSSADAQLYLVDGPAEVAVATTSVTANGKPATPRQMQEMYRGVKVNPVDLVQGSLVMRSMAGLELLAPEGMVSPRAARRFTWTAVPGAWRFELSTDAGELVHRSDARGGALTLPDDVVLTPGVKYVWGVAPAQGGATPADWTEFVIAESAAQAPAADALASERALYAAWLAARDMGRAAARMVSRPDR